jgi:hypothetical protein
VLLALVSIEIGMKVPMVPVQVAPIPPTQWAERKCYYFFSSTALARLGDDQKGRSDTALVPMVFQQMLDLRSRRGGPTLLSFRWYSSRCWFSRSSGATAILTPDSSSTRSHTCAAEADESSGGIVGAPLHSTNARVDDRNWVGVGVHGHDG